jgi:spermidine synthase
LHQYWTTKRQNNTLAKQKMTKPGNFSIQLSGAFIFLSIVISTLIAYSVGWISRLVLLTSAGINPIRRDSTAVAVREASAASSSSSIIGGVLDDGSNKGMSGKDLKQLPAPKVLAGKQVPYTTYTSKSFPNEGTSTSNTLHIDRTVPLPLYISSQSKKQFIGGPDFRSDSKKSTGDDKGWKPLNADTPCHSCSRGKEKMNKSSTQEDDDEEEEGSTATSSINEDGHNDDSDGLHLPAGQHLLVDIKDVDSEFLNSEERLASAMIDLTNESKLTLLSYHCHSLVPIGVSCAGVLLESHVAFHTWPLEGVITLDLFTCGGGKLVPLMPLIERLFSVKQTPSEGENEEDIPEPTLLWAHKLRGFREGFAPGYVRTSNPLDEGLGWSVLGRLDFDMKRPLLSTKTAFQHVDIYEVLDPDNRDLVSYQQSLFYNDDSYEAMHPEFFVPNKILFLDGVQQSTLYGDAPHHESIVHPAMFTHASPKRVAIIGGGEGATLREVLKHNTVEKVVMIEIDEKVVELSREYLKEWSDCSDIDGSVNDCFEDPRTEVLYEDAMQYFMSAFPTDEAVNGTDKFDVILMDALDPNVKTTFAVDLYTNDECIESLYNGLAESGILVVQLGEANSVEDPADEAGQYENRAIMMEKLEKVGFKSMHIYNEVRSFLVCTYMYMLCYHWMRYRFLRFCSSFSFTFQ